MTPFQERAEARQRRVVQLKVNGHDNRRISTILGINIQTVRNDVWAFKDRVTKQIEERKAAE